jgi:amidophosphoribosyltransferase
MRVSGKPFVDKLNEECAVFGVSLTTDEAAGITYNGLLSLQHRGQEGAGIAVANDRSIVCRKGMGLVSEVFSGEKLTKLPSGRVAVGHTRYSTTGNNIKENAGPFITEYLTGRIATSHNGNITNAKEIREELKGYGLHFTATSDSEVVSSLIAYCIMQEKSAILGIIRAAGQLRGAFSLVIASSKNKLIAVRDPNGFRPLCIGKSPIGLAVSSESCALDTCGFEFVRDVRPGEIVTIENGQITHEEIKLEKKEEGRGVCIFE